MSNREKKERLKIPMVFVLPFYITKLRLVFKGASITPDRYLTVSGILLGLLGLAIAVKPSIIMDELTVIVLVVFILWVSAYISFFFTRLDTNDFTKVLSNAVTTEWLIRILAFEVLRFIQSVNNKKKHKSVRDAINKNKNTLRTIERLKAVLAKRLMLNQRSISDDFLQFSATVYVNAQVHRASLYDYVEHLQRSKISVEGDSTSIEIAGINQTAKDIEEYLYFLITTKLNLSKIEPMFQTRSVSTVTLYFISILASDRNKLYTSRSVGRIFERKQLKEYRNNFQVLATMQKSHRTGVSIYRSIGIAIMIYLDKLKEDSSYQGAIQHKKELLIRAKSVIGEMPEQTDLDYLNDWLAEAQECYVRQRLYVQKHLTFQLGQKIRHINKTKKNEGEIFIIVPVYSRIVRYIFDFIATRDKLFDGVLKDLKIVIPVQSEENNGFGSRLMFHHLTQEYRNRDLNLSHRTWRSTPEAFVSRFDRKKDHLLVLAGCDRIGDELSEVWYEGFLSKGISYHSHSDTAYLPLPINSLKMFKKANGGILDIYVVGGCYKYDLKLLIDHIDDTNIQDELRTKKRKRRRSGLYEWKSSKKGYRVKVFSYPLLRRIKVFAQKPPPLIEFSAKYERPVYKSFISQV
ncbi:MAG: hypothetical protein ACI9SP_000745 [Arenicella sp.]|jgi:hypothetical protein